MGARPSSVGRLVLLMWQRLALLACWTVVGSSHDMSTLPAASSESAATIVSDAEAVSFAQGSNDDHSFCQILQHEFAIECKEVYGMSQTTCAGGTVMLGGRKKEKSLLWCAQDEPSFFRYGEAACVGSAEESFELVWCHYCVGSTCFTPLQVWLTVATMLMCGCCGCCVLCCLGCFKTAPYVAPHVESLRPRASVARDLEPGVELGHVDRSVR
eukprot:gb/GFBE01032962.1/.p1 GENE.gb/GFBE01032962.1/~~gb/GFBE01032962.1/.p1  ORF type:complete len:213 (+),score=28.35 gb/GFBE01032962.1/:1-639(+)